MMILRDGIVGDASNKTRYVQAAERAAHFLLDHHLADGSLIRTSRPSSPHPLTSPSAPIPGFLDDYAFLAHALVALHKATGDDQWRHGPLASPRR